jgi:hypothetical protein
LQLLQYVRLSTGVRSYIKGSYNDLRPSEMLPKAYVLLAQVTLSHLATVPSVMEGESFGIGTNIALLPGDPLELADLLSDSPARISLNAGHARSPVDSLRMRFSSNEASIQTIVMRSKAIRS